MDKTRIHLLVSLGNFAAKKSMEECQGVRRAIDIAVGEFFDTHGKLPELEQGLIIEVGILRAYWRESEQRNKS